MRAAAEEKVERIISELVQTRGEILDAASSLSAVQQDRVFLGVWSVKDLLAHLVGWDLANLRAVQEILAGELPSFYAHYDRDWKTFNARLVAEHRKDDFTELLQSVQESHRRLVNFLETVPPEEFDKDRGLRFKRYKVTIARILHAEADDEKERHAQIVEFRDSAEA